MDSIVRTVIDRFKQRSEFGQKKYGTNLDRKDLSFLDWVQHMQEELMDATLYLEKLKTESASIKEAPVSSEMFVPIYYRLSIEAVDSMIYSWNAQHRLTWGDLLAIDYAQNHSTSTYMGGLSFIDRLYDRLHVNHPFWNREMLKASVKDDASYITTISAMLASQLDIDAYGI